MRLTSFGFDSLDPLHALKTDCDDLIEKAFNGTPPQPYFEGFVVITSPVSLDVTAVYSGSGDPGRGDGEARPDPTTSPAAAGASEGSAAAAVVAAAPMMTGTAAAPGIALTMDVEQIKRAHR